MGQRWLIVGPSSVIGPSARRTDAHAAEAVFELERGGELRIGRHPTNDLVVAESHVSRLHALLRWPGRAPSPVLEDLGSANGTILDGRRVIGLTPLRTERATIELGPIVLTARFVPGEEASAPAHLEERVELDLQAFRAAAAARVASASSSPHGE